MGNEPTGAGRGRVASIASHPRFRRITEADRRERERVAAAIRRDDRRKARSAVWDDAGALRAFRVAVESALSPKITMPGAMSLDAQDSARALGLARDVLGLADPGPAETVHVPGRRGEVWIWHGPFGANLNAHAGIPYFSTTAAAWRFAAALAALYDLRMFEAAPKWLREEIRRGACGPLEHDPRTVMAAYRGWRRAGAASGATHA